MMAAVRPRPRPPGFTLVEMLVVIGVLVVLVALTVAVIPIVTQQSAQRETRATLRLLELAVQEWELAADRQITFGLPGNQYEMEEGTPHVFTISELLNTINRHPGVQSIIANINPNWVRTYDSEEPAPKWLSSPDDPDPNAAEAQSQYDDGSWDGALTVLDAWSQPIRVVHPGWRWQQGDPVPADDDGTIRVGLDDFYGVEDIYGVAANRKIAFVSAGADERFGCWCPGGSGEQRQQRADNLYSYELLTP